MFRVLGYKMPCYLEGWKLILGIPRLYYDVWAEIIRLK
jgi:hypothetical protein